MSRHRLLLGRYATFLCLSAIAAGCVAGEPQSVTQTAAPALASGGPKLEKGAVTARVDDLIAVLETGSDDARFDAALALADLGSQAAAAVPALMKQLRRDAGGTQASVDALVRVGRAAVPALAQLLDDRDRHVQQAAWEALAEIGPDAADAIATLLKRLDEKESDPVHNWMIVHTETCGFAIASSYPREVEALAAMKSRAVEQLLPSLAHKNRSVRGGVVFALGEMGPEARDAAAALIRGLERETASPKPDSDLQSMYIWALGQIGPPAKAAVPLLQKTLAEYEPPKATSNPTDDDEEHLSLFREADPFNMAAVALTKISPHDLSNLKVMLERLKRQPLPHFTNASSFWGDFGAAGAKQYVALSKNKLARVRRTASRALL